MIKKTILIGTLISFLMAVIPFTMGNGYFVNALVANGNNNLKENTASQRLMSLEPESPQNINDPPWGEESFPSKTYPIKEIIEKGKEIPLEFVYDNPNWKRQSYKWYWHSTIQRWSYVPNRIHYAMHRLFTTYPTASAHYDFIHELGIADESKQWTTTGKGVYDFIETVVMQAKVEKVITYGNQVVLIARPQRNGLQVLKIPTNKIEPINPKESILFQLTTEQGDEIDYSLLGYIKKDK